MKLTKFIGRFTEPIKNKVASVKINENYFDLGILALINTSIINVLLPVVLILILFNEKALHLIFSNINTIDPFVTSFLIFIFCLLNQKFYFKTKTRLVNNNIPKSFILINELLIIPFPLYLWFSYLVITQGLNPISALFATLYFIVTILILSNSQEKRNKLIWFKIWFLLITILFIFLYNIILYESCWLECLSEWLPKWLSEWLSIESRNENVSLLDYVFRAIAFFSIILIVEKISQIKGWYILLFSVISAVCFYVLISIGSIRPFDVLILYFIILRLSIYYIPRLWNLAFIFTFFPSSVTNEFFKSLNFVIKNKVVKGTIGLFFLILLPIVFFNAFRGGNPSDRSQFSLMDKGIIKKSINSIRSPFSEHVNKWLTERRNNPEPIYLVAGQGGGSRAGCTFFTSMCLLDEVFDNNLLAMTTISGSSNGAGFYLGLKYNNFQIPSDSVALRDLNIKLYSQDYITHSLFKLLFTDALVSWFPYFNNRKNRNESLIAKENQALNSILENHDGPKTKDFLNTSWDSIYKNDKMPVFIPVTYNISLAKKAISSPYTLEGPNSSHFESILDSTGPNLTIGESISLSEMFPIISASASVNGHNYMDGGVYDNGPFETLNDIYSIVKSKRDSICSHKKIILISIENSPYEEKIDSFTTDLKAIFASGYRSIFSSNPITHFENLNRSVQEKNDSLVSIPAYNQEDKVVMSRFLKEQEINVILSECIQKKVVKSKNQNFYNLYFDYGKNELTAESLILLKNIKSNYMSADSIFIRAFADNKGSLKYNKRIIDDRGKIVKEYLKSEGANIDVVKIKHDHNAIGERVNILERLKDRRVEIELFYCE